MNLTELTALVSYGESEQLEFKRSTGERKEAAKTLCAMRNGQGGRVVIGISDAGKIVGQQVTASTQEDIAAELARIEPFVLLDIEIIPVVAARSVIVITTPGGGGPFTYDGRPFMRVGTTTRLMSKPQHERLLLEQLHGSHRWETQTAQGVGIADLDHPEILRTVEEAIRRGRLEDPGTRDVAELLAGFNLMVDGRLLNAAVVLFGQGRAMLPHYPQCVLRMARFRGKDKREFIDNRQEYGSAFDLLVRAQRFLRDHLPIAGRILPNVFERVDDPLYPPAALREALANALCHRDYAMGGGATAVAVYDDRLEITSTGQLPFGLTVGDLLRPHNSRPWNPLIAQVFYRRGIIESWGRGTLRIAELSEEAGLVPPEFEATRGEVTVRFPLQAGPELSALQQEVLAIMSSLESGSLSQIRALLKRETPERTLQDNLVVLRQAGLLELTGRGKGARWTLKSGQL